MGRGLILGSVWLVTLGGAFYFGFVSRDPMPPEYQELLFEQVLEESEERKRLERERELLAIPGDIIRESSIYQESGSIQLDFQNTRLISDPALAGRFQALKHDKTEPRFHPLAL